MMTQAKPQLRLFVPGAYREGMEIVLNKDQSHYLATVMRKNTGDMIALFNGEDGEWLAEIANADKKQTRLELQARRLAHQSAPDVWLVFAPIKNKSELVVEKATELGASKIIATFMRRSVATSINAEKLNAHAIEAAEQCERHDVPAIEERKNLQALLAGWPKERTLLYADESGSGAPLSEILAPLARGKYALLVGPEGGFAPEEKALLAQAVYVKAFGMGPRILRADTAAVAALACIQSQLGDWHIKPKFEA